jgi:hypothetical protein
VELCGEINHGGGERKWSHSFIHACVKQICLPIVVQLLKCGSVSRMGDPQVFFSLVQ